ncbi:MAG: DUF1572 domain-containing protein [Flavobacterium sp.]
MNTNLSYRLLEVFLHGTWIANTNYKDQLQNINWEKAIEKHQNLNSIALLTFHIQYYVTGILYYFENGSLDIKDQYSFDIPTISNQEDWDNLKNVLFDNVNKLAQIVDQFSEKDLEKIFVKEAYGNVQRNIDALIEHAYYHLGQIVLINKLFNQ